MKKVLTGLVVAIVFLFTVGTVSANDATGYITAGINGDAWTVEAGGYKNQWLGGLSVFGINNNEVELGQDTETHYFGDYYHYETRITYGKIYWENEVGLGAKLGYEPVKKTGIYLLGSLGWSCRQGAQTIQTKDTYWFGNIYSWKDRNYTENYTLFGYGIGYFPKNDGIVLQLEHDNRRGTMFSIGIAF